MLIVIRKELERDYRLVEQLARDAFWNLYIPGAHEHYMIHNMRSHPDFIKELSFLIEVDGKVQGAIFYTKSKIVANDDSHTETITMGPLFISQDFQERRLAKMLIAHSIKVAKEMGATAIITQGYPYHYESFGFISGKRYGVSMPDGKFYLGTLVLPLYDDALENVSGYVQFSDALEVDESQVDQFDSTFDFKEKAWQESQDEFAAMVERLDV